MRDQMQTQWQQGGAWDELIKLYDIRKKFSNPPTERRQKFIEVFAIGLLVIAIGGFIFFLLYLYSLK